MSFRHQWRQGQHYSLVATNDTKSCRPASLRNTPGITPNSSLLAVFVLLTDRFDPACNPVATAVAGDVAERLIEVNARSVTDVHRLADERAAKVTAA